jgi:hypothetical protein
LDAEEIETKKLFCNIMKLNIWIKLTFKDIFLIIAK